MNTVSLLIERTPHMNLRWLRGAIIVLTLATAIVHLAVLNIRMGQIDPAFTANGVGYLASLGAWLFKPSFLAGREREVHYAYIGYTVVTILAWVAIGQKNLSDPLGLLGYATKTIELLLIGALWQYWRLTRPA